MPIIYVRYKMIAKRFEIEFGIMNLQILGCILTLSYPKRKPWLENRLFIPSLSRQLEKR